MSYMNDKFIFCGIYSDKYEHYYLKLKDKLKLYFSEKYIEYQKVPQSIFDNHKNFKDSKCHWCGKKICKFVFHQGETIKIEKQLEIYNKYINTSKIIIFTDSDITPSENILSRLDTIYNHDNFNKFDIFYAPEPNRNRWKAGINIGLNLSFSTQKIIDFYEQVLSIMKNNSYPNNWDQMVVNKIFYEKLTDVTYDLLPTEYLFNHKFARGLG